MTAKTVQSLNDKGFLIDEYANKLLDLIQLLDNGIVSMIVLGHDGHDGHAIMKTHFEPLSNEQLLDMHNWWYAADVHADTYGGEFDALTEAARRRWPKVRIFHVPGCLCCNGIDNLLEYDCER